jgi:ABC-type uncharacterized transport system involved in gliding motility auxiliary subunit
MNKWTRFLGILGIVLVLFGVIGGLVAQNFANQLILAHLILGFIALIAWCVGVGFKGLSQTGKVVTGRGMRFGANAVSYFAVFLAILIVLNWFISRNDKRWDVTEEGVHSLADQSQKVVQGLKKPLKMVAFKVGDFGTQEKIKNLFELYKYNNSSLISYEIIDPRTKPHLVDKYGMKQGNLVYLAYGEEDAKDPSKLGVSRINEASEEALTNAILKLTRGEAKKIYYVTGHDEPDLNAVNETGLSQFSGAISDEHLSVEPIFLGEKAAVPENAAMVILAAPKKPLRQQERDLLIKYVEGGGSLFMLTEPRAPEDVRQIAEHFNIEVGKDVLIDQIRRLFDAPALGVQVVASDYGYHPISKGFSQRNISIFSMASSVRPKDKNAKEATYTELVKSSPQAWAETDLAALFDRAEPSAQLDDKDIKGPVSLAVVYEKKLTPADAPKKEGEVNFDKASRVVVFGSVSWLLNANLEVYANRDLGLNVINWLVGEEGGVSIRPKSLKGSMTPISAETFTTLLVSSFIIPEFILLFGLLVWWFRRTSEV